MPWQGVRWAACTRKSPRSICLGVLAQTEFKMAFGGAASVCPWCIQLSQPSREGKMCGADRYLVTPRTNLCDLCDLQPWAALVFPGMGFVVLGSGGSVVGAHRWAWRDRGRWLRPERSKFMGAIKSCGNDGFCSLLTHMVTGFRIKQ